MSIPQNVVGDYQIVEELGRGAMATVYLAHQTSQNRYVAIKVLSPQLSSDPGFVQRFQHEARAAAGLHHPNIVAIDDVGHQVGPAPGDGPHYLVMDYIEDETLEDLIQREGSLPSRRVARIIEQVAAALDYAHQRGFVHGSIKPSNIFVGESDHVTVTDFGIAQAAIDTKQTQRTGLNVPPPEYTSPEQARGEPIDYRSDLYALGVTLYQMLVGFAPFRGTTPRAVLQRVLYEPPPSPRQINPNLSPNLEAVLLRSVAKDPRQRFQRGAEMVKALRGALAQEPPGAPAVTLPPAGVPSGRGGGPAPPFPSEWPAEHPEGHQGPGRGSRTLLWILAGISGVLLVAVIVLLVVVLGGGPAEETPIAQLSPSPATATSEATTEDTPVPSGPTSTPEPSATSEVTTEATTAIPPLISDTPTSTPTQTASPTTTATPTSSPTDTATPTLTPTPTPCAVAVDAGLAAAWNRDRLGCPTAPAAITWAAWEPFERGHMFWRDDADLVYVLHFRNGTNVSAGDWQLIVDKWDGVTDPEGIGLSPPAGLYEPIRGFGWVWRTFLNGPSSAVGWATDEEKGFCAKIQPFEEGLILHSDTVEFCDPDNQYNWATHPSFSPLFFALYEDGRWRRY
jgi:serine/threonine protein kinase